MNDAQLDRLLKQSPVPDRSPEFWQDFPRQVAAAARTAPADLARRPVSRLNSRWSRPAIGVAFATACIVLAFSLGVWKGRNWEANDPQQIARMRKYFQEVAALFPNQVQAIVFDQKGARLVLAREPNVAASAPVYLNVCGPQGCEQVITFSGQQIPINGDVCEVLVDHTGKVFLVGERLVWRANEGMAAGRYRIRGQSLDL